MDYVRLLIIGLTVPAFSLLFGGVKMAVKTQGKILEMPCSQPCIFKRPSSNLWLERVWSQKKTY